MLKYLAQYGNFLAFHCLQKQINCRKNTSDRFCRLLLVHRNICSGGQWDDSESSFTSFSPSDWPPLSRVCIQHVRSSSWRIGCLSGIDLATLF